MRIARVATVPNAFTHILKNVEDFNAKGIQVDFITSKGEFNSTLKSKLGIKIYEINIARDINFVSDLISLFKLTAHFSIYPYDIVHSSTPKAGLICSIASFLAGVKVRCHTFTGQRWATQKGLKRFLQIFFDRLIVSLNSQCYADSHSQVQFLKKHGIGDKSSIKCLGDGSFGGIDLERFNLIDKEKETNEFKERFNIPESDFLILYVGRIAYDKGFKELFEALEGFQNYRLVLVGNIEDISEEMKSKIKTDSNIIHIGFCSNPESYMKACDLLVLPSYREGFGSVVIEAAACGTPCIGTRIPGLVDSIEENKSGLLVEVKNSTCLRDAILSLKNDPELLNQMSQNGIKRAKEKFSSHLISKLQMEEYQRLS